MNNILFFFKNDAWLSSTPPAAFTMRLNPTNEEDYKAIDRIKLIANKLNNEIFDKLPMFDAKAFCKAELNAIIDHINTNYFKLRSDAIDFSLLTVGFTKVDQALGSYLAFMNSKVQGRGLLFFTEAGKRKEYLEPRFNQLNGKFNRTVSENKEFATLSGEYAQIKQAIDVGEKIDVSIGGAVAAIAMGEAETALLKAFPPTIKIVSKTSEKATIKASILGFDLPETIINQNVNEEFSFAQKDAKGNILKTYAENYTLVIEGDEELRTVKASIVQNETGDTIAEIAPIQFAAPPPPPPPSISVQPLLSENQVGTLTVPVITSPQVAKSIQPSFTEQANLAKQTVQDTQSVLDEQRRLLEQSKNLELKLQDERNKLELQKLQNQMELEQQKSELALAKAKLDLQAKADLNTAVGLSPKPAQIPEAAPIQTITPLQQARTETAAQVPTPLPEKKSFLEENKTAVIAGGSVLGLAAIGIAAYFMLKK